MKKFNWASGLFIIGYHLLMLVLIPIFIVFSYPLSASIIIISILTFIACGLSITVGYHRYFSHRTFKSNRFVEAILLLFGTLATQGSALRWSFEHRLHHSYVDTDKDPYSVKTGFWHAHILWLFKKDLPIDNKVVSDLRKNPLVMFQDKYYPMLMLLANALLIVGIGFLTGSFFASFLFVGLIRIFAIHHSTWFINSLAHYWGSRTYSKEHTAVDNYCISLLTFGEGYHNYHHTFAQDYRNGIKWYHFDPSKWIIWGLSKIGMAKGLKTMNNFSVKKKLILSDEKMLLEKLKGTFHFNTDMLESCVNELSSKIVENINQLNLTFKAIRELQKEKSNSVLVKLNTLKADFVKMQSIFSKDRKSWIRLTKEVLKLEKASPALCKSQK